MPEDQRHFLSVAVDHRRLIALAVSFAVFAGVMGWRLVVLEERENTRVIEVADQARASAMLAKRLALLESDRESDRSELESRLQLLASRNAAGTPEVSRGGTPLELSDALASVVEIVCIDNAKPKQVYTGSGTVVDDSGLIVTNKHMILSEDGSLIRYCGLGFTSNPAQSPKLDYLAAAVALHKTADLAILRITERLDGSPLTGKFQSLNLNGAGDFTSALELGDAIYIAGYPGVGSSTFTLTQGVVSGRVGTELIKTSALIDSGTSGGAAFDAGGHYVGVPSAAAKGNIGGSLGYLIPGNAVETFIADYFALKTDVPEPARAR